MYSPEYDSILATPPRERTAAQRQRLFELRKQVRAKRVQEWRERKIAEAARELLDEQRHFAASSPEPPEAAPGAASGPEPLEAEPQPSEAAPRARMPSLGSDEGPSSSPPPPPVGDDEGPSSEPSDPEEPRARIPPVPPPPVPPEVIEQRKAAFRAWLSKQDQKAAAFCKSADVWFWPVLVRELVLEAVTTMAEYKGLFAVDLTLSESQATLISAVGVPVVYGMPCYVAYRRHLEAQERAELEAKDPKRCQSADPKRSEPSGSVSSSPAEPEPTSSSSPESPDVSVAA